MAINARQIESAGEKPIAIAAEVYPARGATLINVFIEAGRASDALPRIRAPTDGACDVNFVHPAEFSAMIARHPVGDGFAIGRPDGIVLEGAHAGERSDGAARNVDHRDMGRVELTAFRGDGLCEGDAAAVGRPRKP